MARLLLTDAEWALIAEAFPEPASTGRPRRDPRQVLDGVLWVLRTGSPWRDLPPEFGAWKTAWRMFDAWNADGTLAEILHRLQAAFVAAGGHRRRALVHRRDGRASGALRRRRREKNDPAEPGDHALGRSRGGFSTKIHLLCDGRGLPLHFHLTAGQANESTVLDDVLIGADAWWLDEGGEPIAWPLALGGDRAYRANWIDEYLLELGIKPVIPSRETEHCELRLVKFDKRLYRRRNVVERLIGWLKESRRIFARYEKTAKNFGGMIILAFIKQYLRYELV